MIKLPDGSGCFTGVVLTHEEAINLPLKDRPLNYRLSGDIVISVYESLGTASMCWDPVPSGVFDSTGAAEVAHKLCLKIADYIENEHELFKKTTNQ